MFFFHGPGELATRFVFYLAVASRIYRALFFFRAALAKLTRFVFFFFAVEGTTGNIF